MVVFHVSTFILQLHLAGGFDFGKFFIFLSNVDFYRNIFGFLLKSVDDYHK